MYHQIVFTLNTGINVKIQWSDLCKVQGSVFVFELNSLKLSSDCFSAIFPIECMLVFDYFAVELQVRYAAYLSYHET